MYAIRSYYGISAPGTDSVTYKVTTGSFDSNISLTSASYTVTVAGDKKTGTITGIPFGTTAKEVMAKLVKPGSATWMFTDGGDAILSTVTLPTDSNKFKIGARNELLATEKTYIEVRARITSYNVCYTKLLRSKDSTKNLQYFVYEKSPLEYVVCDFRDSLHVYSGKKAVKTVRRTVEGVINSSLWNTMNDLNLDPTLAIELSDVYAWSIDFFGIAKGDKFQVVFNELYVV